MIEIFKIIKFFIINNRIVFFYRNNNYLLLKKKKEIYILLYIYDFYEICGFISPSIKQTSIIIRIYFLL